MAICEFWNSIYTCESDTKRIFRTCQGVFYTKSSIFINGILDN
jgi:hypothetical protein